MSGESAEKSKQTGLGQSNMSGSLIQIPEEEEATGYRQPRKFIDLVNKIRVPNGKTYEKVLVHYEKNSTTLSLHNRKTNSSTARSSF